MSNPKIIITVSGGNIQSVHSNIELEVLINDLDLEPSFTLDEILISSYNEEGFRRFRAYVQQRCFLNKIKNCEKLKILSANIQQDKSRLLPYALTLDYETEETVEMDIDLEFPDFPSAAAYINEIKEIMRHE